MYRAQALNVTSVTTIYIMYRAQAWPLLKREVKLGSHSELGCLLLEVSTQLLKEQVERYSSCFALVLNGGG